MAYLYMDSIQYTWTASHRKANDSVQVNTIYQNSRWVTSFSSSFLSCLRSKADGTTTSGRLCIYFPTIPSPKVKALKHQRKISKSDVIPNHKWRQQKVVTTHSFRAFSDAHLAPNVIFYMQIVSDSYILYLV